MQEMFLGALKLRSCAILLEHKVKAFQMKNPQAKFALPLLAVLIAVIFSSNFYLLPAWARAAGQEQQPSPTTGSNPFGLTLSTPALMAAFLTPSKKGSF